MPRDSIIFYVEDDSAMVRLVEKNLQRHSFPGKVIYFQYGETFLDFLQQYSNLSKKPDRDIVILLDLNLMGISGISVLGAIRQSSDMWIRQLPVIVFSISSNPHDQEKCESLGCTAFLQKSFDDDRLIRALQKIDAEKACVSESQFDGY